MLVFSCHAAVVQHTYRLAALEISRDPGHPLLLDAPGSTAFRDAWRSTFSWHCLQADCTCQDLYSLAGLEIRLEMSLEGCTSCFLA